MSTEVSEFARQAVLRRSVLGFFSRDPYLSKAVTRLLEGDVQLVEDLLKIPGEKLNVEYAISKTSLKRMNVLLNECGMELS